MGCGKSTIGRKLASSMGWAFCDTDNLIAERESRSITEIFKASGEEYFRKKEREVLEELSHGSSFVVACGGGMPCYNDNMRLMKESGIVVYLKMTPEALMSRLSYSKSERPVLSHLSGDALYDRIVTLLDERSKFFDQAHFYFNGINVNLNGLRDKIFEYLTKQK